MKYSSPAILSLLFLLMLPYAAAFAQLGEYMVEKSVVFEIGNAEAETLLRGGPKDGTIRSMLHTPVGTMSRDGTWDGEPPRQGHFLTATIDENRVGYRYVPVMPFKVFLYKEYGILTLQVVDADGEVRSDAKVKIEARRRLFSKRIRFDAESHIYRIDDWSDKRYRILSVELDGFRTVLDLEKHLVSPYHGWGGDGFSPDFYSYMLTDKNKYKPGETVRFKSYALTGSRRAMRQELEVWLDTPGKYQRIGTLAPYNPGGYEGEIHLHDSLGLRLDNDYSVILRTKKGRSVAYSRIRYEDYVLYDNTLDVQVASKTHYYPDDNDITIKVTDANGMLALDVQARVEVRLRSVDRSFSPILRVPEVLMSQTISLDNGAPTVVTVPAGIMGDANGSYDVKVEVQTYDGQVMNWSGMVIYRHSACELDVTTRDSLVRFELLDTGRPVGARAEIRYTGSDESKTVTLPYEEEFRQNIDGYEVRIEEKDFRQTVPVSWIDLGLGLDGEIEQDSFKVRMVNPMNLEVSWYLYRGNMLLEKGSGTRMEYSHRDIEHDQTYYAELFYFVGGNQFAHRRTFAPKKEYLTVDTDLPDRIYPGQQVSATVEVTDNLGRPVKGVDITAMAYNNLLGYDIPDLDYYGPDPKVREQRSSYSIGERSYQYTSGLDYKFWNPLVRLDTIPYYRFAYPGNRVFTTTLETPDGTTQFSPYVFSGGVSRPVYVVEVNEVPVWFSWAEQPREYSFPIEHPDSTYEIMLRLDDRAIILKEMKFAAGVKTILSVDRDDLPRNAASVSLHGYGSGEAGKYRRLLSYLPVPSDRNRAAWLYTPDDSVLVYHPLFNRGADRRVLVGPLDVGGVKVRYQDGVEYRHSGGYSHSFEDNVVYKYSADVLEPMRDEGRTVVTTLNDMHLSTERIEEKIEAIQAGVYTWRPSSVNISGNGFRMKFNVPADRHDAGVANLLFIGTESNHLIYPSQYGNERTYSTIASGLYDAVLVYGDGRYLRLDSLEFRRGTYLEVDLGISELHEPDSASLHWRKYSLDGTGIGDNVLGPYDNYRSLNRYSAPSANSIYGYVFDEDGEPLPGATVLLSGTDYGTVTDHSGYFQLDVPPGANVLLFSYIGFMTQAETFTPGSVAHVVMENDSQMLDEVVVLGYGTSYRREFTGAMGRLAGYDSGSNPSSIPADEFDEDEPLVADSEAEDRLYQELIALSSLRTNFSDVGLWQPALVTDRKGRASFNVTFPDNITKWDAVVYAMNRRLQTGTYRKSIRSYKPIMAELRMPGFLVEGDRSYFAGNLRNYTSETAVAGTASYIMNGDTLASGRVEFETSHPDRMLFTAAGTDTLVAAYVFNREDGYMDGEERRIAVIPQGTEVAEGSFGFLGTGEPVTLTAGPDETLEVEVTGRSLDMYLSVADYLGRHKQVSNDQLASRLIGLLTTRMYYLYEGRNFRHDREVNDLIRRLVANRNDQLLWSWIGKSDNTSVWMSTHILKALRLAREAGYRVDMDISRVATQYMDVKRFYEARQSEIEVLHELSRWGVEEDYAPAVDFWLEKIARAEFVEDSTARAEPYNPAKQVRTSYLQEKLLLWDICRMQGLTYSPDSIAAYLQTDIFGAVYCDDGIGRDWYRNDLVTTLLAYEIVRADSALMQYKEPMQAYVLGTRSRGWNTYYGASAVATMVPDLLESGSTSRTPGTLSVSGSDNRTVTAFPYETRLDPGQTLTLTREGGGPLLYSAHSYRMVTGERTGDGFEIKTRIGGDGTLRVGLATTLDVEITVKQRGAEYVMVEIPIPAGCDYAHKPTGSETYREYYKEKTVVYYRTMSQGVYNLSIPLLPRFPGSYTVNPAKVELMYFPVVSSNNDMERVELD